MDEQRQIDQLAKIIAILETAFHSYQDSHTCVHRLETGIVRDKAVEMERRLEGMNEFRNALKDQAGLMFSRAEHEAYQKSVEDDLRPLRDMKAILDNKASQTGMNISLVISIIAIIIAVIHLFK